MYGLYVYHGKVVQSIYLLDLYPDFGINQGGLHCYFLLLFYPTTTPCVLNWPEESGEFLWLKVKFEPGFPFF